MYRRQRENINSNNSNNSNYSNLSTSAKVELVTEAEAQQSGTERHMDISAIPDCNLLSQMIVDFIEYYDLPSTKKIRDTNYPLYLNTLYEKFNKMPMSMIKLLSDDDQNVRSENLQKIVELLQNLGRVKKGDLTLESVCDDFTEKQNEEYFYPAFGGKEKLMDDIKSKGGKI